MTVWVLQSPFDPEGPIEGVFATIEGAIAYAQAKLKCPYEWEIDRERGFASGASLHAWRFEVGG